MSDSNKLRKALKRLAKGVNPFIMIPGIVKAIDISNYTCDVDPTDGGATYYNVRLKPTADNNTLGVVIVPEQGSDIIIGSMMNEDNDRFMISCRNIKTVFIKNSSGT